MTPTTTATRLRTTTAATTSALALLVACKSKPDLAADLDQVRIAEHLPALGMMVWRHGEIVASAMTGLRKEGDPAHPATLADQWHLGSDTKAMTATLVGMYVDRANINWDDTLGKLFAGETIDPQLAKVTVDQLLQHRGGLPHDPPLDAQDDRRHYIRAILASPPSQPIGTYEYSNAGYVLLAAAIERASGKTWEQMIAEDLWKPLGMRSCGFGAPTGDQPWGHMITPVEPGPLADNAPSMAPAGGVHCSLEDWGRFLVTHASSKSPVVSEATFVHLHTPPTIDREHYMGGWIISPLWNGELTYAHEGSNRRWHAIAIVIPSRDEVIEIVANKMDDHLFSAMRPLLDRYR
jgi:CubicO group peptidase (beta-lactamase class C family)